MEYKHEIKWGDPLELKPYENNPRVNDYAVKKVLASIEEFGFTSPILVDPDLVIIAGHTRREAAILKGLEKVPYIVVDWMSPEQVKAYRIADNKLGELSTWDEVALKEELFELKELDFPLEVMGFTEMDLKDLFVEEEPEEKEKAPKEEKTTLPMLRFGSNSVRITEDELVLLSNRYNEYADDTEQDYKRIAFDPKMGEGYQSALGIDPEYPELSLPTDCSGSSVAPIGAYWWNNYDGWRVARLGGYWNSGAWCSAWYLRLDSASSDRSRYIGGRLLYVPQSKIAIVAA